MTRRRMCALALVLPAAACSDAKQDRRRRLRELLERHRQQTSRAGTAATPATATVGAGFALRNGDRGRPG